MLTDEEDEQQERAIVSPITDAHRRRLLAEIEEWYNEWARDGMRYELVFDENFCHPWQLRPDWESDETPSVEDWLSAYTGERSSIYGSSDYQTHGDDVHLRVQDTVWAAFGEKFGEDWRSDDDLDDAAYVAEDELYGWLTEALERRTAVENHRWQVEGF